MKHDLPLLEKAIAEANGDADVLCEKLLDNFSESCGALFALLTVANCEPADLQMLKRKLDECVQSDYAQAMARAVGFFEA